MLDDAVKSGHLALPEPQAQAISHSSRDPEVEKCLCEFNLLGQACSDTGEQRGHGEQFHTCPICGHHDCFVVYEHPGEPESFKCFSTNGDVGGTAIDYFIWTKSVSRADATKYLVHDLCCRPYRSTRLAVAPPSRLTARPSFDNLSSEQVNDKDLSRLFAKEHRDEFRFVPELKCFLFYNGLYWQHDKENQRVKRACKEFVDGLIAYQSQIPSDEGRKNFLKKATKYLDECKRAHLVEDIKSELVTDLAEFDRHRSLLNVLNCTIDLDTGECREHSAGDLITKCAPVNYEADARCPKWEQIVGESQFGDEDTVAYIQKLFGKALMGSVSDDEFYIFGFATRSGKSLITGTIEKMLGTGKDGYACNSQGDVFEQQRKGFSGSARSNIAMMRGRRFVVAHEPSEGTVLDASLLKQMTGGDEITVRDVYESSGSFSFTATIVLVTNHPPVIRDGTVAESDRIRVVPFENHIPDRERDQSLKEEFAKPENLSGILDWCLEGLHRYKDEGIEPGKRVLNATLDFSLRSNWTRTFIDDRLVSAPGNRIQVKDVYSAFLSWGEEQEGFSDPGMKQFQNELEQCHVPIKSKARINGHDQRNVVTDYAVSWEPLGMEEKLGNATNATLL